MLNQAEQEFVKTTEQMSICNPLLTQPTTRFNNHYQVEKILWASTKNVVALVNVPKLHNGI